MTMSSAGPILYLGVPSVPKPGSANTITQADRDAERVRAEQLADHQPPRVRKQQHQRYRSEYRRVGHREQRQHQMSTRWLPIAAKRAWREPDVRADTEVTEANQRRCAFINPKQMTGRPPPNRDWRLPARSERQGRPRRALESRGRMMSLAQRAD